MERSRSFDSKYLSYTLLKDDLREMRQENLNWLFEEIEIQFLNEITRENEHHKKKFAIEYYKQYLTQLAESEDPILAEFGKFGLDLLYLQFPDL